MGNWLSKIHHHFPIDLCDESVLKEPISALEDKAFILINNPEDIQYILDNKNGNYKKPQFANETFEACLGRGLITAEGITWRRKRKRAMQALSKQRLGHLIKRMSPAIHKCLLRFEDQAKSLPYIDFLHEINLLTFLVFMEIFFSSSLSYQNAEDFSVQFNKLAGFVAAGKIKNYDTYTEAQKFFDDFAYGLLHRRKETKERFDDILDVFIDSQSQDPDITDQEIRDEIITMSVGGYETCSTTLSFAGYLLSQNKDIEKQLQDEVIALVGDRPVELNDLPQLKWPQLIFKETLRLFPPVYIMHREAIKDDEINGYKIPMNSIVSICPWVMHRNINYWDDPFTFNPERFLKPPKINTYLPFGSGPRVCIGQNFAMQEGPLIIAALAQRFSLESPKDQKISIEASMLLNPKYGLKLILSPV